MNSAHRDGIEITKTTLNAFIYLFINLFKVDNDKKDIVYKNTDKIAWG